MEVTSSEPTNRKRKAGEMAEANADKPTDPTTMIDGGKEVTHDSSQLSEAEVAKAPSNSTTPYDDLRYEVVTNDGKPGSMIKLVGLKSLFAKQLPKMPRAYIARLVFDRRHVSLAILRQDSEVKDSDEEIIGGICFRPFKEMRFAEIAFCAVSATHQVKGYGTKLMNLVKQLGAREGIEYFITYAGKVPRPTS